MASESTRSDFKCSSITTSASDHDARSSQEPSDVGERWKSSLGQVMDKAKSKLERHPSGAQTLADDEEGFQRQKAKEVEKQKRKEEYENLGLGERTKYGMRGGGGWTSG